MMLRSGQFAVVFAMLVVLWGMDPAMAQEPSAEAMAAAREVVEAEKADTAAIAVVGALSRDVARLYIANNPDLEEAIRETAEEVGQVILTNKKPEFTDAVVKIYARLYTAEELRAISEFYKTPAGKKFVSNQDELSRSVLQESTNWEDKLVDTIVGDFVKAMESKGYKL